MDLGLYTIDGGAVVVDDCILDGEDPSGQAIGLTLKPTPADGTAGTVRALWELAGASSDPQIYYDLTISLKVAAANASVSAMTILQYLDVSG